MFDIRSVAVPERAVLRPAVSAALARAPGVELLAALTTLMAQELSAREWLEVACAWRRMGAHCAGGQLTAVAELDRAVRPAEDGRRAPGREDSTRPAADELAPALGVAPRTATCLVQLARQLEQELPAAADALAEGRMDLAQAKALAGEVLDLPERARRRVEALAVRLAPRTTLSALRDALEEEAVAADPAHATRRARAGEAERDVQLRRSPLPGCRRVTADLPALQAVAAWNAVNGAAVRAKDGQVDERTLGQLRADVLSSLLTGRLGTSSGAEAAPGLRPTPVPTPEDLAVLAEVQVVVAADALAGASAPGGPAPARIPGRGALDPEGARALAARAPWRRLVADPVTGELVDRSTTLLRPPPAAVVRPAAGVGADAPEQREGAAIGLRWALLFGERPSATPLDLGATRYRPSPALRAHVLTRDATCIGPACHHPATAAGVQLDHTVEFDRSGSGSGGATSHDDLAAVCRRVHNAKTHGGWRLSQPVPGRFTWTSPLGRSYTRAARSLVPHWSALREARPPPPASSTTDATS